MKTYVTELYCETCNEETSHKIEYASDYMKSVTCTKCHTKVEMDKEVLLQEYKSDFVERILTKPSRMTKELKKDIASFFKKLPKRIATKPKRISDEVKELKK